MKISIYGSGNVGLKIAELMHNLGHEVVIASRKNNLDQIGNFKVLDFVEAAQYSDITVIAIPFTAVKEVFSPIKHFFDKKIVIDATNPLNSDWSPLLLGQENSAGEEVQSLLKEAKVVKAFNTIFADVMSTEKRQSFSLPLAAFVASDHQEAKDWLIDSFNQMGFDGIDVGPLKMARYLESIAHLNIQIATMQGVGTNAAFFYQQR